MRQFLFLIVEPFNVQKMCEKYITVSLTFLLLSQQKTKQLHTANYIFFKKHLEFLFQFCLRMNKNAYQFPIICI